MLRHRWDFVSSWIRSLTVDTMEAIRGAEGGRELLLQQQRALPVGFSLPPHTPNASRNAVALICGIASSKENPITFPLKLSTRRRNWLAIYNSSIESTHWGAHWHTHTGRHRHTRAHTEIGTHTHTPCTHSRLQRITMLLRCSIIMAL